MYLILLYYPSIFISFTSYIYRYLVGLILKKWDKLLGQPVDRLLICYMVVIIKL